MKCLKERLWNCGLQYSTKVCRYCILNMACNLLSLTRKGNQSMHTQCSSHCIYKCITAPRGTLTFPITIYRTRLLQTATTWSKIHSSRSREKLVTPGSFQSRYLLCGKPMAQFPSCILVKSLINNVRSFAYKDLSMFCSLMLMYLFWQSHTSLSSPWNQGDTF